MGGVCEGVLEGTGECSGVRERKRRVLSDSTQERRRTEAASIRAHGHRAYASCMRHIVRLRLPPHRRPSEFGVVLG